MAASREQDALAARRDAENSARFARSRELAASALSVLSEDPSLSKLLAVAAASASDPDLEVASALHRTWAADSITRRITWPTAADADFTFATLHPDGRHVALGWGKDGPPRSLAVFDLESDEIVWDFTLDTLGTAIADAYVTPDGTRVVAGVFWEPGPGQEGVAPPRRELGVHVWDAKTGDLEDVFDAGPCGSLVIGISDRHALLDMVAEGADDATGGCYAVDVPHQFDAMDLSSGERVPLVRDTFGDVTLSGDGRYAAFTDLAGEPTSVVLHIPTHKRVLAFAQSSTAERQDNAYVRGLNRDGSLLLYGDRPVLVLDARSGEVVAALGEATGEAFGGAGFTPAGLAYTLTRDATLRTWDPATGDLEFAAPAAGVGRPTVADDGEILIANENTKTAVLVHPAVRGEVGTFVGCPGFTGAESLDVVGDTAVMATFCDDGPARAYGIDLSSIDGRFERPGFDGQTLALSPDARRYAGQGSIDRVIGALQVHDAATGELLVKLEGVCDWDQKAFTPRAETGACKPFPTQPFGLFNVTIAWSPDGSLVAAVDHANEEGYFAVWDSRTGRLVHAQPRLGPSFWAIMFAPDGATLIASTSDVPDGSPELIEFSTETWEILRRAPIEAQLEGGSQLGLAGFMQDGTLVGVGEFGGTAQGFLHRIDVSNLTVVRSTRVHDGSPKSFGISPDGTRVVTGASDGIVRNLGRRHRCAPAPAVGTRAGAGCGLCRRASRRRRAAGRQPADLHDRCGRARADRSIVSHARLHGGGVCPLQLRRRVPVSRGAQVGELIPTARRRRRLTRSPASRDVPTSASSRAFWTWFSAWVVGDAARTVQHVGPTLTDEARRIPPGTLRTKGGGSWTRCYWCCASCTSRRASSGWELRSHSSCSSRRAPRRSARTAKGHSWTK